MRFVIFLTKNHPQIGPSLILVLHPCFVIAATNNFLHWHVCEGRKKVIVVPPLVLFCFRIERPLNRRISDYNLAHCTFLHRVCQILLLWSLFVRPNLVVNDQPCFILVHMLYLVCRSSANHWFASSLNVVIQYTPKIIDVFLVIIDLLLELTNDFLLAVCETYQLIPKNTRYFDSCVGPVGGVVFGNINNRVIVLSIGTFCIPTTLLNILTSFGVVTRFGQQRWFKRSLTITLSFFQFLVCRFFLLFSWVACSQRFWIVSSDSLITHGAVSNIKFTPCIIFHVTIMECHAPPCSHLPQWGNPNFLLANYLIMRSVCVPHLSNLDSSPPLQFEHQFLFPLL